MPIYIRPEKNLSFPIKFTILNNKFTITAWEDFANKVGNDQIKLKENIYKEYNNNIKFTYCVQAESSAHDHLDAWNKLEPSFFTFRGLLELQHHLFNMNWSYPSNPLHQFTFANAIFAYSNNKKLEVLLFNHEYIKKVEFVKFEKTTVEKFKDFSKPFTKLSDPKSTIMLLSDCLRLYMQSMDDNADNRRLMSL